MISTSIDVTRRPVTAADDAYLRELFAESREDLALLPAAMRDQLIDLQFRAQRSQYASGHPEASHEILVVGGEDVGRLMLDGSHVVDITIGRAHRRRGIATATLREVIAAHAPEPTTLEVWFQNHAALTLYERLGFERCSNGEGYLAMAHRSET